MNLKALSISIGRLARLEPCGFPNSLRILKNPNRKSIANVYLDTKPIIKPLSYLVRNPWLKLS